jgi:hypothetical protein
MLHHIGLVGGRGCAVVKFTSQIEKLNGRWPICPWLIEGKWGVNSSNLRRCEIANLVGWPQPWLRNNEPRTVFQSHVSYVWIIWCRRLKQSWSEWVSARYSWTCTRIAGRITVGSDARRCTRWRTQTKAFHLGVAKLLKRQALTYHNPHNHHHHELWSVRRSACSSS